MDRADHVDLNRFMGDWYVLAHVPARAERAAYDAVESYAMRPDGSIDTTYTFRRGGHEGPEKVMRPRGYVVKGTGGAEWRMQFFWPIRLEYLIAWIDDGYTETIIARTKRDYLWIMARSPHVDSVRLEQLIDRAVDLGYHRADVRIVPHAPAP